jgi:tetratricopeptide (TPR) repeat protein
LLREIATDGRARLVAQFGRSGTVRWINDPEIGDRIAVALVGGPAKGVDTRRATVEAALLPSAHGAVIEPRADGVTATFEGGNLIVTRGEGLIAASPQSAQAAQLEAALLAEAMHNDDAPAPAAGGLTLVQVRERIDDLTRRAALEGTDEGAPVTARLELARFLLQHEFAHEAIAVLRMAAINQGEMVEIDPEYRLMRAAAYVMMGRPNDAMADLNASALRDDPSAALLRGYAAAQRQEWMDARRELDRGQGALEGLPPGWRARIQLALARAALELNDIAAAEAAASSAMGQAADDNGRYAARLVQARIAATRGDPERALTMLDELSLVRNEEVAVQAIVEAIRLRRRGGELPAAQAVEALEALRYRWRGDGVELTVVGMLGDVYSELGRWREAMSTMRIAADRFPTNPIARHLRADMSTLFERLFLDGEADQLEPIQALGLFYEFSDITPVGPNGDRIVRLLAGRLVHVDLLEQAAQLLQHQVDERLQGLSRAQVAGDLAAIYLMDHKPDQALVVLANTRQANMPALLLADRRILEARALLELGRLEGAVELVERDRSENAQRVRAEAAWRARDWDRAAVEIRGLLALRDRAQPLDEAGRLAVLRAGVAMTLAENDDGVRTLYREFAGDMAGTESADAFEVVAAGINADGAAIRDVARAVARTDLLDRFMHGLRDRMTVEAAQAGQGADVETPTPQAAAPQAPTG